jgi:hypothetical protein
MIKRTYVTKARLNRAYTPSRIVPSAETWACKYPFADGAEVLALSLIVLLTLIAAVGG